MDSFTLGESCEIKYIKIGCLNFTKFLNNPNNDFLKFNPNSLFLEILVIQMLNF